MNSNFQVVCLDFQCGLPQGYYRLYLDLPGMCHGIKEEYDEFTMMQEKAIVERLASKCTLGFLAHLLACYSERILSCSG